MGFWSSLFGGIAGAATSLIPGVGPILAPMVGGALSSIGGGNNKAQTGPQASTTLPAYQQDPGIASAESYLNTVLNGSRGATESMLSPQVSTVLEQYDNAAKTAANLGPRGGGRTQTLAEAPFKKAGAYGQALAGATSGAAKELGQLGEEAGRQRNQYAEAQGNLNLDANKLQFEAQQAANKQAAGVGGGIADVLTSIIGRKKKGGGGGGDSSSPVFSSAVDSALGLGGQGSTSSFDF